MKKIMFSLLVAALVGVGISYADTYTYTVTAMTNGQVATSDPIPVSGWLDKVEWSQLSVGTATVVVATYDGTSAVETFASLSANADDTKVVRPRFLVTANTGSALAGAVDQTVTNSATATTTMLIAGYEKALIGGNAKVKITNACESNDVKVVIYYEPLKK